MKKLFLFSPHEDWEYCEGLVLAVAETFDEAIAIAAEQVKSIEGLGYDHTFYEKPPEPSQVPFFYGTKIRNYTNRWVLHKTYDLAGDPPTEVIFSFKDA